MQDETSSAPNSGGISREYGDVTLAGNASAHLGDVNNHYYIQRGRRDEEKHLELRAFYYESMNGRKNQILSAKESTCDWIWSSTFGHWLHDSHARVFWISGKPGSGKSTLMKYLANASQLKSRLPAGDTAWRVMSFFFNFRRGSSIANSAEGLMRGLLKQVVPYVPSRHADLDLKQIEDKYMSLEELHDLLHRALKVVECHFLVLIDGLDEFTDNIRRLIKGSLLPLGDLSGIKLCLASRREPMILSLLECFPNLHMSDHNAPGIQQYIDFTVEGFKLDFEDLHLENIRDLVYQRAEGVFLWVFLALEEIVTACSAGANPEEIIQLLEMLPKEVEELYDRILTRIPQSRKPEAAVMYTLVAGATFGISLDLLRATMHFLSGELSIQPLVDMSISNRLFVKRVYATMGGLLEVCTGSTNRDITSEDGTSEVRLIHETVRSFSTRSRWPAQLMPSMFAVMFPSQVWARVCCKAILTANCSLQGMNIEVPTQKLKEHVHYSDFFTAIRACVTNNKVLAWARLLYYSIECIVIHAERDQDPQDSDFTQEMQLAMQCPASRMHLSLFEQHIVSFADNFSTCSDNLSDIMLAAVHFGHRYLLSKMDRIRLLSDRQRSQLILGMLGSVGDFYGHNCLEVSRRYATGAPTIKRMRRMLNSLLECDENLSSLHLSIFIRLGYAALPPFLRKRCNFGWAVQTWPRVELPPFVREGTIFASEPPLFIWVCEYKVIDNEPLITAAGQLRVILSFGVDINSKSSEGYNVVHYLITKHLFGHAFLSQNPSCWAHEDDMTQTIAKLYLVEEAGADFEFKVDGDSPLEALRRGRHLLQQASAEGDEDLADIPWDTTNAHLAHVEAILYHKELTRHLPQPGVSSSTRTDASGRPVCTKCSALEACGTFF